MNTAYLYSHRYIGLLQPIVVGISPTRDLLDHIRPEDTVKDPIPVVADAHVVLVDDGILLCP